MEDYNSEQESYREKSKDRIQKQLQYGKENQQLVSDCFEIQYDHLWSLMTCL